MGGTICGPYLLFSGASSRRRSGKLVAAIAASRVVTVSSSRLPVQPFLQESVVLAFRKFYPESWLVGHKFPMLEDLINQPPFTCYLEWRANNDLSWDGPLNPCLTSGPTRLALRMAEGKQAGAMNQRTPLLSFGLDPDRHFALALQRARVPLPTEALPVLDDDLRFAGACCAEWRGDLRQKRKQAIGALKELKSRLASTTALLAQHQSEAIRQVTQGKDFALTLLILVIVRRFQLSDGPSHRPPCGRVRTTLQYLSATKLHTPYSGRSAVGLNPTMLPFFGV